MAFDFYLLRWNTTTLILFVLALAIWLWRVDKDLKDRGKGGLFSGGDWW